MTDDTSSAPPSADSTVASDISSVTTPSEPASAIDVSSPSATQPPTTFEPVIPEESQSAQESKVEPPAVSKIETEQHTDPSVQTPEHQPQTPAAHNQTQSHRWSAADRARASATHTRKIQEHLDKIIAYARTKPHVTNDEIEKLLHVSDATASRYALLLVKQGILRREGKGRGALYVFVR